MPVPSMLNTPGNRITTRDFAYEASPLQQSLLHPRLQPSRCQFLALQQRITTRRRRNELLKEITIWRQQSITALQSLIDIPEFLETFEKACEQSKELSSSFIPENEDMKKQEDSTVFALNEILSCEDFRNEAMSLKGSQAQRFCTHLQMGLDWSKATDNDPAMSLKGVGGRQFPEKCLKALRKIVKTTEEVPPSLLIEIEEITIVDPEAGKGGYGIVKKGKWGDKTEFVAVKEARRYDRKSRVHFCLEAVLWRQLNHPNIVPFAGILREDHSSFSIVSTWMPNGTLSDYIKNMEKDGCAVNYIKLLYDTASGLKYLHNHCPSLAHGDIKPVNVLVDADQNARLADFGITKLHYTIDQKATTMPDGCSYRYAAPELLEDLNEPTPTTDIWSFGMLTYEVITGDLPYKDIHNNVNNVALTLAITREKQLPTFPNSDLSRQRGFTDKIWQFMNHCWERDPKRRPTIEQIECFLSGLLHGGLSKSKEAHRETVYIPFIIRDKVMKSPELTKARNSLNVRISQEHGFLSREDKKFSIVTCVGDEASAKECRRRIENRVKEIEITDLTLDLHVEKHLRPVIVGKGHKTLNKLMKDYRVQINVPKESANEPMKITGHPDKVKDAQEAIKRIISQASRFWRVIPVLPRVAKRLEEKRDELGFSFTIRDNQVMLNGSPSMLNGSPSMLKFYQSKIQAARKEIENEITAPVVLDHMLFCAALELLEDLTKRYGGSDAKFQILDKDEASHTLTLRGPNQVVVSVNDEVRQMVAIGCDCVWGMGIKTEQHEFLMHENQLVERFRKEFKVLLFFPKSPGYGSIRMPANLSNLIDKKWPCNEIVKIVGKNEENCREAKRILTELVDKKEIEPLYIFPVGLSGFVRKKLADLFRTTGISIKSTADVSDERLSMLLNEDPNERKDNNGQWPIYRRTKIEENRCCTWRLTGGSAKTYELVKPLLFKELNQACTRLGVVELSSEESPLAKRIVSSPTLMTKFGTDMAWEIEDKESGCRLIVGGTSTRTVETFIETILQDMDSQL